MSTSRSRLIVVGLAGAPRPRAARGHRPGEPRAGGADRPARAASLRRAAGAVPHDPADVAGPRQHGGLSHPRHLGHSSRRRPVALRSAVAAGPQQRRSTGPPTGPRRSRSSARRRCRRSSRSAARRTLERQYATIEITDSVAMMGGHQVGHVRGYHGRLQQAVRNSKATC